jgi:asparagine synthase (glutamine-hydrolysing)
VCGICGIVDQARTDLSQIQQQMLDVITHRGPDDRGTYYEPGLALGMQRLSIIDLAGGKQPIYNEDEQIVVILNGEIYNYRSLRRELEGRGHQFRTESDTEVIVHLYETYGVDCVKHLRGMFAFAIWDSREQTLLVARDHLGVKPLYYAQLEGQFIFASEIKSILRHPAIEARLNLKALSDYLSLRYVAAPKTLFEGIHSLPPGHRIIHKNDQLTIESYWDVEFSEPSSSETLSDETYIEQLEALLKESVEMQLMSDVPFGAFLSGGVDSSLVVALMSQFLSSPVKTFSAGYRGGGTDEFNELPFARQVADHVGTEHYEVIVTPDDFLNYNEKIVWHLDQPLADYTEISYFMVSQLASKHVKMVLTGEGGDELFAGYARYAGERYYPLVSRVPSSLRSLAAQTADQYAGMRRAKAALYAFTHSDEADRHINWLPNFNGKRKKALLTHDVRKALGHYHTSEIFGEKLAASGTDDRLNRMLYTDTKLWLPDYLLIRGDKLTMASSLEGRVPLLDHKLVEFAARLPTHLKINGSRRKYLLKQVAVQYLPPEIIRREKKGFPVPVPNWLRHEANQYMRDHLSNDCIKRRGLFNHDYVEELMREHEAGFADHATMLYGLINLEHWFTLFVDSAAKPSSSERTL